MEITQEMIDQSAQEENEILSQSAQVLAAQNQHLHNRVVVLRALVNEQQKEIEKLKEQLAPKPRKAPADRKPKKTAVSRPTLVKEQA